MKVIFFLTLLLPYVSLLQLYSTSLGVSTRDTTHYVAAVVEYTPDVDPERGLTAKEDVSENIQNYEELIAAAKTKGADIIVFPEVGLTGINNKTLLYYEVPNYQDSVSPCLQFSKWSEPIRRISCAAHAHQIYVAINLYEQHGSKRHNTNVVFDRNGVVVSRYRKLHLFNEPNVQVPDEIDYSVFETDFGVTFGVAICFDLLFREPASELVHTRNIRHFVYSTAWFSELPFLTAVQTQAAWAWSHNSVLLASGLNDPGNGNAGSGIHIGRIGSLKAVFTDEKTTRLLVSRVPKNIEVNDDSCFAPPPTEMDIGHNENSFQKLSLMEDHMHAFATELLPLDDVQEDIKLCYDQFCCHFNIQTESKDTTSPETETRRQPYRLFVWNGVRDLSGAATAGVQFCAVVACKNTTDVETCAMPIPNELFKRVQFTELQIRGEFESNNTMVLANTLNQNLLPLPADAFRLSETEDNCNATGNVKCLHMELTQKHDDIQTFAIYNRVFGRDNSNYTHTNP